MAIGCILCVFSALALPWARVSVTWKSLLFKADMDLGSYTFKLTENAWLTAALVCLSCLCLAGLAWKRRSWSVAAIASLLLSVGCAVYLGLLFRDALDFLGLYRHLLELIRAIPVVGQAAEEMVRERLAFHALPHVGVFLFAAGTLLILAGGLLLRNSIRSVGAPASSRREHIG
ncbi:MAG: hypothetical protein HPY75_05610 [Actinobacteria bacterium]|nr:hypothetical protein [Actinomycetota bacterium]